MGVAQRALRPNVLRGVVLYATLTAIATCALFPILWAMSGSLKTAGEVTMPTLFPAHPQWSNYRDVFAVMPFWRMFFNSVLYAGCVSIGQVFFCSLAGYAFARLRFRGRDTLFVLYLGTLMVPLTVTVIPQFILMRDRRADRHSVGHDRAGVVRQRIRHLPDAPVLPYPARRTRGSGNPRRLLSVADLLADTAPARKAGGDGAGGAHLGQRLE